MIRERELLKKDKESADVDLLTRDEVDQLDSELAATLTPIPKISQVLMDDNLMEFTKGKPFPMKHRAKLFFHKIVVGIMDYLRQVSYALVLCCFVFCISNAFFC